MGDEGWQASAAIRVGVPPERVWAVVSDIERHPALAGSGEVRAVRLDGPVRVGTIFEGEIEVGSVGTFTSRNVVEEMDRPRRLAWVSYPPLDDDETDDHQIEVHWSFDLAPTDGAGTDVLHRFHVPPPKLGADDLGAFLERTGRLATVRAGMEQTLANVKAAAEGG